MGGCLEEVEQVWGMQGSSQHPHRAASLQLNPGKKDQACSCLAEGQSYRQMPLFKGRS